MYICLPEKLVLVTSAFQQAYLQISEEEIERTNDTVPGAPFDQSILLIKSLFSPFMIDGFYLCTC